MIAHQKLSHKTTILIFPSTLISFCTNVPIHENVVYLWELICSIGISFLIPIEYLRELIKLCTHNIRLDFVWATHKQIDGLAIGSPLDPEGIFTHDRNEVR